MINLSSRFKKLAILSTMGLIVFYLQIVITERQQYMQAAAKRKRPGPATVKNQTITDPEYEPGKQLVRSLLKHAWTAYKTHAWGGDELLPLSKSSSNFFGARPLALSIVDALDTLLICDLHSEYKEAAAYVLASLTFDHLPPAMKISLFESNIRVVGGLLAVFGLTGDGRFASKAFDLAQRYLTCFKDGSVLPKRDVDLGAHVRMATDAEMSEGPVMSAITAEVGTLLVEWAYLSYIVKDPTLRNKAYAIVDKLGRLTGRFEGLLPRVVNVAQPESFPQEGVYALGGMIDSYYEYLLKFWLQSGKQDKLHKDLLLKALPSLEKYLTKTDEQGRVYLIERERDREIPRMEHLACFAGGFFALAGKELHMTHYIELGANITETCYRMYSQQATGLGPESAMVPSLAPLEPQWIMRPEVVESIFVMYRLTRLPQYRQWGLQIARSIEQYARLPEGGLTGIKDANQLPVERSDKQESFFLAETLKYLYLLFCDVSYISLDEFVFNTEAHPLPIIKSGL